METIGYVMYPGLGEDERLERVEKLFDLLSSSGRMDTKNGIFVAMHGVQQRTITPLPTEIVVVDQFQAEGNSSA